MKTNYFPETILFLNENPLPSKFTTGTISGKELRLRSALSQVREVHVLAPKGEWVGDKKNETVGALEKKIIIHHIPTWPYYLRAIPLFFWGFYWTTKVKPDLLEAESPIISGPATLILGKVFRKPVVVEVRASYFELIKHKLMWIPFILKKKLLDFVYWNTLEQAQGVIANSRFYQRELEKHHIVSSVINPGIRHKKLKDQQQYPSKPGVTMLGFLGRLEFEKGMHLLLEALEILVGMKNGKQKFELLVAGEGSQRKKLEKYTRSRPKLRQIVKFLGFQPAQEFFPKIDIFINPNIVLHPLEMVNAEAAFFGKPVVCFGNDLIPETVEDGVSGLKCATGSTIKLAESMRKLALDSNRLDAMSLGMSILTSKYSFRNQKNKLNRFYEKINLN